MGMMDGVETNGVRLNIGWFVGYAEKNGNVYFFATNIESPERRRRISAARIDITKSVLRELSVMD
jgi:beta-lactamase class D